MECSATTPPPGAVLARLAPNTPPRGEGRGKGKGRRATVASSSTPLEAAHEVNGEERPVSGSFNVGSGLEEFQLKEAIRASRAEQDGSAGGKSSAGCTPGRGYRKGTNSECSDSSNVFELADSDSDEEWVPGNKEAARRIKEGPKKKQQAGSKRPLAPPASRKGAGITGGSGRGAKRRKKPPQKKEHKPSCTKGGGGAWNQNHASRPRSRGRLLNSAGQELTFREHLAGLDVVVAPLDGAKAARSINEMREEWNAKRSTKGSFYTHSGTKGLSSQNRGPPGGAHDALDKPGLRPIGEAIVAEDGLMVNYRFMPGGHERVQDAHADGGDPKVSRLLATLHTGPNQPPANLEFQMRKDPAQHPRSAALVVDPATGQPFKHVVQKGHGTLVIGDGAAFGREGSLIHQVTAAQGGRGGRGGSVTILVDIEFPEEATKEQRRAKQRNIAGRLASLAGSTSYATELKIPDKGNVDASNLSTTNTAHNNTVVRRRDGTSTTRAALQGEASIKKRRKDPQKLKDDCAAGGEASIKEQRKNPEKFRQDRSDAANVAHVDAATGVLVRRDAPNAVRTTEGGAALKGLQTGGAGNPHGSSKNTGLGEADRQAVCVAGYTDEGEAFGICLGMPTLGFKKGLKDLVEPSGRIVVKTLCNKPNFPEPGRTRNRTTWATDSTGRLILGYHRGQKSVENPRCQRAGTLPGVLKHDSEGVLCWHVADWAVDMVRAGNVVFLNTHNSAARVAPKAAIAL